MTGYLNYNRKTRVYLPTMRVSDLGNWLPSYIHSDGDLRALVDKVQRLTDETVGIVAQNDLFIQYIMMKTPTHEFKAPPAEGDMRLMIDSTTGLAMLSRMRDRTIEKIFRYTRYHHPDMEYFANLDELMREIRRIRYMGYVYMPNRPTPQLASLGMPLDEEMFGIPLALGVGGFHSRIAARKDALMQIMRDAVAEFRDDYRETAQLQGGRGGGCSAALCGRRTAPEG